MVKGMTSCKVCGRDFPLIAEEHYVVRDSIKRGGVIPALNGQEEAALFDAFDCPHCGCQNVMQPRKAGVDEDVKQSEDAPFESCCDCKYDPCGETDEPCVRCCHNGDFEDDYFVRKEKE